PTQLAAQTLVFEEQLAVGQQPANLAEHFIQQDRLHQVIVGAALESFDGVLHRGISRDQQHERLGAEPEQAFEQLDPVHARQLHVAQRHVKTPLADEVEGLFPVATNGDFKAHRAEVLRQCFPDERFIVHDQDTSLFGKTPLAWGLDRLRPVDSRFYHAGSLASRTGSASSTWVQHSAETGSRTRKTVPCPGRVSKCTVPPWLLTSWRVTNKPRPVPCFLVVKYG